MIIVLKLGPPGVTNWDSGSVGLSHFLSHGAWMSDCMWRSRSVSLGGDMGKSPLLATSCPHSLGQTSRTGVVWTLRPGPAAGWEPQGRQREHGAVELVALHFHTAHLQQTSVITSLGPKKRTQQGKLKTLTNDYHTPGILSVKGNQGWIPHFQELKAFLEG